MIARGKDLATLDIARPAPTRALPFEAGLPFAVWMALARATPVAPADTDARPLLGAADEQA